ncbi:MAG: protein-disulfide reductase DsbD [Gammaproteobacteria bacterium]|nr:protein-disulfide reductase DsbD [Gammaproteobacteria bacterium]
MHYRLTILQTMVLVITLLFAKFTWGEDEYLRVEQAFTYKVSADANDLTVLWNIAPGYYLYKSRMAYSSRTSGITLGEPVMEPGEMKEDDYFGLQEVFRQQLKVVIPYSGSRESALLTLLIKSQGCADKGLCYPPQRWETDVTLPVSVGAKADGGLLNTLVRRNEFGTMADEFLPVNEAFRFSAIMFDDYTLMVRWDIADGYYLYRDKLSITGYSDLVQFADINWPAGVAKTDEHFGAVKVFYYTAEAQVPVSRASKEGGELLIEAGFQGCAEDAICYPPGVQSFKVTIPPATTTASTAQMTSGGSGSNALQVSEQDKLAGLISTGALPAVLATFFGLGLLLAFTPCVLPMVPILSGIIGGQKEPLTTRRSFILSLVYVLAMALTYTIIGVIVGLLGGNIQAMFQNPVVLISFSLVFVALALAMFDVWQFQVPVAVQNKISHVGTGGGYMGVAVMGVLSALIVGPCVAAPLVGALIFIGQSGDAVRGGLALFALSIGMGTPLLVYGATAGQLMLRAGAWMETIKRLFGIMLLGVAIWLLARILPVDIVMLLWAALAVATAWVLGLFRKTEHLAMRSLAGALLLYGAVLAASGLTGGYDPASPLRGTPWGPQEQHLEFQRIKSVEDLQAAVAAASSRGQNTMLDFYADWCVECIKMEKDAFSAAEVQGVLENVVLLQADVTENDAIDKALMKHLGIIGPPTIAFYDRQGNERRNYRVVGFMAADEFARHSTAAVAE